MSNKSPGTKENFLALSFMGGSVAAPALILLGGKVLGGGRENSREEVKMHVFILMLKPSNLV